MLLVVMNTTTYLASLVPNHSACRTGRISSKATNKIICYPYNYEDSTIYGGDFNVIIEGY